MSVVSAPRAFAAPLLFERVTAPAGGAQPGVLGGRLVGSVAGALQAPLLAPAGPGLFDRWQSAGACREGSLGSVRYRTDGHWLHGSIETDAADLREASRLAYGDLFRLLAKQDCRYLLRIWNYFAGINLETGGSERYRQFNAGRQQAFIEAGQSAFEGAPAACALGTQGGGLSISFLAGQRAPVAIENPRQVSAYRYPEAYGPRTPTFSRAAAAQAGGGRSVLFISGTASIVGHESLHAGDVRRQTEESLRNIAAVLRETTERTGKAPMLGELVCTIYLRRPADLAVVREVFEQATGAGSAAARGAIYLQADICRDDLLVEIEAHGFMTSGVDP